MAIWTIDTIAEAHASGAGLSRRQRAWLVEYIERLDRRMTPLETELMNAYDALPRQGAR